MSPSAFIVISAHSETLCAGTGAAANSFAGIDDAARRYRECDRSNLIELFQPARFFGTETLGHQVKSTMIPLNLTIATMNRKVDSAAEAIHKGR